VTSCASPLPPAPGSVEPSLVAYAPDAGSVKRRTRAASSGSKPSRQWPGTPARASFRPLRSIWSFLATFRNIAAAALEALIVAVTAIDKAIVGARQDPPCRPRPAAGLYY
jgi:hypothetical protein